MGSSFQRSFWLFRDSCISTWILESASHFVQRNQLEFWQGDVFLFIEVLLISFFFFFFCSFSSPEDIFFHCFFFWEKHEHERIIDWLPPIHTRTGDRTHSPGTYWLGIQPVALRLWDGDAPTNRVSPARAISSTMFCSFQSISFAQLLSNVHIRFLPLLMLSQMGLFFRSHFWLVHGDCVDTLWRFLCIDLILQPH